MKYLFENIIEFLKPYQPMSGRAFIQFCIILIGVAFEVMGTGYELNVTLTSYWQYEEPIRALVYNFCEHCKFILLVLLMWRFPARAADFKTDGLFVVLAVLDFGDYLLTGNSVWIGITLLDGYNAQFPVSMNMVSIVLFFLYAHNQWKMNGSRELY